MRTGSSAKLALLLGSTVACLILAEITARLALPSRYYVWPPGTSRTNDTAENLHGVRSGGTFTINVHGMRGDAYEEGYGYRVLAVGGSTTICTVLDDAIAWPHAVQEIVNQERGAYSLFVGNVGRPGHGTIQNTLQVEKLLAQYEEIDAVLVLAGVNDMLMALFAVRGFMKIPPNAVVDPSAALQAAFSVVPVDLDGAWYAPVGLTRWIAARRIGSASEGPVVDVRGNMFLEQRQYRRTASNFVDTFPSLDAALVAYQARLHRIVDLIQAGGARPILLTQPSVWRDDLPREVEERLWLGGPPLDRTRKNREYLTASALAEALALFNDTMLAVCAARRVECIDLARELGKKSEDFWDDVHYTDRGSRRVAEIIAGHLLDAPPFLH